LRWFFSAASTGCGYQVYEITLETRAARFYISMNPEILGSSFLQLIKWSKKVEQPKKEKKDTHSVKYISS
jgi:hypothetical protein